MIFLMTACAFGYLIVTSSNLLPIQLRRVRSLMSIDAFNATYAVNRGQRSTLVRRWCNNVCTPGIKLRER